MRAHAALQTEAIAVDCFELSNLRFKGLNLFDSWIFKGLIYCIIDGAGVWWLQSMHKDASHPAHFIVCKV